MEEYQLQILVLMSAPLVAAVAMFIYSKISKS
jgi:hypothetical protein